MFKKRKKRNLNTLFGEYDKLKFEPDDKYLEGIIDKMHELLREYGNVENMPNDIKKHYNELWNDAITCKAL